MEINTLSLRCYRNFQELDIELPSGLTVLCGKNGIGKTNILESIYFLSNCNSFRTKDINLISHTAKSFLVKVAMQDKDNKIVLQSYYDRSGNKTHKINGKKSPQHSFVGRLKTVTFTPDDLNLLNGSPAQRRKLIDGILSQVDKEYYVAFNNYKRILNQRNHVLYKLKEGRGDVAELEIWNVGLVKEGAILIQKRMAYITFLNKIINDYYQEISGLTDSLNILYAPSFEHGDDIRSSFYKELFKASSLDFAELTTSIGPHRDDLEFILNGRSAKNTASRGEFRTIILSFKLSEIRFLELSSGSKPIFLLDDVLSELDQDRRNYLISILNDYQTLITMNDNKDLSLKHIPNHHLIKLDDSFTKSYSR